MPYPVMSGLHGNSQGVIADSQFSAWRGITPYTAGYLTSGTAVTGTGNILDARVNGFAYGGGYVYWEVSGNTVSGAFLGAHDTSVVGNWRIISSIANTAGTTATAQWSGYYPYITFRTDYVSGATNTGTPNVYIALK